jgi:hypothetical protein
MNNNVDKIKRWSADCIDFCEEHKHMDPRLAALAMTAFEDAAMWAVKLVTTQNAAATAAEPPKQAGKVA